MKRFAFFLAVFSVGLMIFLVATGQFGRLFQAGSASRTPSIAEDRFANTPGRNEFSYNSMDLELGRPRFELRGFLPEIATLNPKNYGETQKFSDVAIRIPLYDDRPNEAPALDPTSFFSLRAEEAILDRRQSRVLMSKRITGEGADGMTVETNSLVLSWDEKRTNVEVEGDQPVMLSHPQLRLHAGGGISGHLATKTGLGVTSLKPPVVAAVDRRGAFLTLGAAKAGSGEEDHLIFVSESHPLVIDNATQSAQFAGPVRVYAAPVAADSPIFPAPPLPAFFIEWPELQLFFDKNMALKSARSAGDRTGTAIRAKLTDDHQLEGANWEWTREGDQEWIHVVDGVRLSGTHGEFTAREAWVYPVQNRCVLSEEIRARLAGNAERKGLREGQAVAWLMTADWAEVFYDPERKERANQAERHGLLAGLRQLKSFRAISNRVHGVQIVEDFPDGARLYGSELGFDGESGILRLKGDPRDQKTSPIFEEGKNRIVAGEAQLALDARRVEFFDGVDAFLYSLPAGAGIEPLQWASVADKGASAEIHSERVRIAWGDDHRLSMVRAERAKDEKAASYRYGDGEEAVELTGDSVEWTRESGTIIASGEPGKQYLSTATANLFAGLIRFRPRAALAEAEQDVHIRADGIRLLQHPGDAGASAAGGGANRTEYIDIFCQRLVAELRTPAERKKMKDETGQGVALLKSAQAWGGPEEGVQITDGEFVAEGERLAWQDDKGLLVLDGKGRQRVFRVSNAGRDEMSAQRIALSRDQRMAELEGDVICSLHQKNHPAWKEDTAAPDIPWRIRARTMQAVFPPDAVAPRMKESNIRRRAETQGPALASAPSYFLARDHVTIDNTELGVHIAGSVAEWSAAEQRLRIFSEDGTGVQTCYYGTMPRDEIVAREISVVYVSDDPARLNIFFEDVVNATVHVKDEAGKERRMETPTEFRLSARNLLVTVERAPGEGEGGLSDVLAWGDVNFQGGPYKVLARRSAYDARMRTATFFGDPPRDPVHAIVDGNRSLQGDPIIIKITESGYEISTKGRYPWDLEGIERMLGSHGAKGRAPKSAPE